MTNKAFDRIITVMFENQYRSYAMQDKFLLKLANAGMNMTNYFGCFHPSQTNYLAALAGEVCSITNDDAPTKPLMQQTLVDLMEQSGVSWKAYMEAYPSEPWNPAWVNPNYPENMAPIAKSPQKPPSLARYFRKHNAFASFHSIQRDKKRWSKITDDAEFWNDVNNSKLPEYSWFTPDIWNDGHYLYNTHIETKPREQLIPQLSKWLEYVFFGDLKSSDIENAGSQSIGLNLDVDLLLTDPEKAWAESRIPERTLIVVTFDEADYNAVGFDTNYDGPNQIYTVLLGDMIPPNSTCDLPLNHYSAIRTVEKNFGLGHLGKNDKHANYFRPLWNECFKWRDPQKINIPITNSADIATVHNQVWMVYGTSNGINQAILEDSVWRTTNHISDDVPNQIKLCPFGDSALLITTDASGKMSARFFVNDGWSNPTPIPNATTAGDFTACSFTTPDDTAAAKVMLVWQLPDGYMQSMTLDQGVWQQPHPVGQLTDGPIALAQFGFSLYLVYKKRNSRHMHMTSYNLANFNSFEALAFDGSRAVENDTSVLEWTTSDFPVGHFAKKFAALQNDYQSMGRLALAAIDGEMRLIHRGAYSDTPSGYEEVFGLTGIMSSCHPYSNGFGTLDQAGWTTEQPLPILQLSPDSCLSITGGENYVLVWQKEGTDQFYWTQGEYS